MGGIESAHHAIKFLDYYILYAGFCAEPSLTLYLIIMPILGSSNSAVYKDMVSEIWAPPGWLSGERVRLI